MIFNAIKRRSNDRVPIGLVLGQNAGAGGGGGLGIIQEPQAELEDMNRRKKINQLLKAHAKKASAKLAPKSKDKYISKADRLKLEAEATQDPIIPSES